MSTDLTEPARYAWESVAVDRQVLTDPAHHLTAGDFADWMNGDGQVITPTAVMVRGNLWTAVGVANPTWVQVEVEVVAKVSLMVDALDHDGFPREDFPGLVADAIGTAIAEDMPYENPETGDLVQEVLDVTVDPAATSTTSTEGI